MFLGQKAAAVPLLLLTMNAPESGPRPNILDPKANLKALSRIIVLLIVLGGGIWLYLRYTGGSRVANQVAATVLRQPIELKNSIETLPAASIKGLGVNLPYAGSLLAEVSVVKGNEINIYVVAADQIENVRSKKPFTQFTEFEAAKAKNYKRTGRLAAGQYYLVLVDETLGILSASSSDVSVHLRLEP